MNHLTLFVPLAKADAAQRLVYGHFDETPDRAGEVFDYASSKPNIEAWSDGLFKASGGKSYGNVRAQHDGKKAAGLLKSIAFDDEARRVEFCAHIVDDQEWAKVEAGVYTGFSPGGRYAKRWKEGAHTRYTADVAELSIVDVPCNPAAGFTMVKADGSEAEVEFVMAKAYEPGNEATKDRAADLAKAAGKEGRGKDFVVQARAELISENATAALAKMAEPEAEPAGDPPVDRSAALDVALAKADAALAGVPTAASVPASGPFGDLGAVAEALRLLKSDRPLLQKGLYTVRSLSDLLQQFAWLQAEVCFEAKAEGDSSPQPGKAAEIVKAMGDLLIGMVQEEVAELIAGMPDLDPAPLLEVSGDAIVLELASSIVDLVKADADLMEKAGARNSKKDAASIQAIHDEACGLGAVCADASAEKATALAADNERLAKSVDEALPRIELLATTLVEQRAEITKMADKIASLEAQPVLGKGQVFAIDKSQDVGTVTEPVPPVTVSTLETIGAVTDAAERSRLLEGYALQKRHQTPGQAG